MAEAEGFESVLDQQVSESPLSEVSRETEEAEAQAQPDAETQEQEVETQAADEEPKQSEKPEMVPIARYVSDRKEWQEQIAELKRQNAMLEGRFAQVQEGGKPQEEEVSPYDRFIDDPTGYVDGRVKSVNDQFRNWVYQTSEYRARQKYSDYDDVKKRFLEAGQANPALFVGMENQINTTGNPAEFAYQEGKRLANGGVEASTEDKIRADERAKVLDELAKKNAQEAAANAVKTNAGIRNSGKDTAVRKPPVYVLDNQ